MKDRIKYEDKLEQARAASQRLREAQAQKTAAEAREKRLAEERDVLTRQLREAGENIRVQEAAVADYARLADELWAQVRAAAEE